METVAVTEYTHSRVSDRQREKTVPRPVFAECKSFLSWHAVKDT
jgi:hypothetical protein